MKKILATTLLVTLSTLAAQAGANSTRISCGSASEAIVIAGKVAGQGKQDTNIQYSIGSFFRVFDAESIDTDMTNAVLNVSQSSVRINVGTTGDTAFVIESKDAKTTKLKKSNDSVSGSFVGLLSGTDLTSGELLSAPIELRCYVSDSEEM